MKAPSHPAAESPSGASPPDVVGRNDELQAIDRFLARLAAGPAAIVFEGRPGIGKTTVWRHALERAAGRSLTVLSCRPVEAETKLAFASLADLLEPVAEAILPALPEPQHLALEVALMRASPPGTPPSARAVATAVLSAFRVLALRAPVLIAVDDQQWLDRASAEALAFALRRLGGLPVGVAAAVRVEHGVPPDPLGLDRAFAPHVDRVHLGPLSLGALHHVIRAHLDHAFSRPTLRRIGEASDGNPFFALELARALIDAGAQPGPGEPLPVPDTLTSLVVRRLDRLPARTRDVLLVVAALSAPTVTLVRRVANDDGDAALARATQARVIDVHGDRIRFTHPLLASAVYTSATHEEARAVHRRLAHVVADPEERARHLALAAAEADEEVASVLDEAAVLARRRGAPDAAGELQERAARLTVAGDPAAGRWRRILAAEHFFHAGDRARASALLEGALAEGITGMERAKALHLLGNIRGQEESFAHAIPCLEEALSHAEDPASRVMIEVDLTSAIFNAGYLSRAASLAREALADAERLSEPGLLADALCLNVVGDFITGRRSDHVNLKRALALEDRRRPAWLLELRPTSLAGIMAIWEGRLSDGHALLHDMCEWAAAHGEESGVPFLLFNLSWLECLRGDFTAAVAMADEGRVIAEQSGSETMRAVAFVQRGRARAARGDVAGARADFTEGRQRLEEVGYVQAMPWLLAGEGALELSLGDAEAAERAIAPLVVAAETVAIGGLFVDFAADAVEALVRGGLLERADALLARFMSRAQSLERPWALASGARCRSILALARGELDAALAAAEEATASWGFLEMPVESGRASLALGQVRRRRGERRLAREALERAREVFQAVGATLWAERASEELGRIPIRRAAGSDLTPTEERVATLAGAGRTNAEVAKALFMSPKTVEANLTRIYDKLGIKSRAELGARMHARAATDPAKK